MLDTVQKLVDTEEILSKWPNINSVAVHASDKLGDVNVGKCVSIIDDNLGGLYTATNGKDWKTEKRKEIVDTGIAYILFESNTTDKLLALLSFKIVNEYGMCLLYLYEIQIAETLRGQGLGTYLIDLLNDLVLHLNKSLKLSKLWYKYYRDEYEDGNDELLQLTGIGLTVFSGNDKALRFYQKLGFTLHTESPQDKLLRSGRVIKPDYYIMERKMCVK